MQYNIVFMLRGPCGSVEAPNNTNPVEAKCIEEVMEVLIKTPLKLFDGVRVTGISIKEA